MACTFHALILKPISGLASALALGAAGAWVGTRFMMTPEAKTTDAYKARLLEASSDDTVITRAFTGSPLRALQNSYTKHFAAHPEELGVGGLQVRERARLHHTMAYIRTMPY